MDSTTDTGHLMLGLLEGFMWLDQGLQQNLAAMNLPNVRRLESMLMLYVAAGLVRPSALAKKLGVTRQSVNTAIRELERKGLITLRTDPDDLRCKVIEFAASGQVIHATAAKIMTELEKKLERKLGATNTHSLASILAMDWGDAPLLNKSER